jgi:hypothetical protein
MVTPSTNRFKYDETRKVYYKHIIIDNKTYELTVPEENWSGSTRRRMNNLLKKDDILTRVLPESANIAKISDDPLGTVQCQHCKKHFSRSDNLHRHETGCKIKNVSNIRIYNTGIQNSNSHNDNSHDDHSTNHHNTTHNDHRIINNYHGNVTIQPFGKENTRWLTEGLLMQLVGPKLEVIKKIMERKHFNNQVPENQNIRLNTKRDVRKQIQVFRQGKWRLSNIRNIIVPLCFSVAELITTALEGGELIDDFGEDGKAVLEKFRSSEYYQKMEPKLKRIWNGLTNIIDDENENDLIDILVFLLLDKKLQEDQEES